MPQNNLEEQTLKEALEAEGNEAQASLLTDPSAANLKRKYIINIINTGQWGYLSETGQWENVSEAGIIQIRDVSVMRVKNGQPVFPWNDQAFLDQIHDDLSTKGPLMY